MRTNYIGFKINHLLCFILKVKVRIVVFNMEKQILRFKKNELGRKMESFVSLKLKLREMIIFCSKITYWLYCIRSY